MRRQIYQLGNALYIDRLVRRPGARDPGWQEAWRLATTWTPPELPVSGKDVLKLGLRSGRHVGTLVAAVERWWIDRDFTPDRAACLAELQRLVESGEGA